jgi:choline dehydrogenase-like flavoprotein
VVGPDLQSHELPGLYVMDASAFPTNLGVNPQHSIMTVVWRAAEQLANAGRDSRVA